MVENKEPITVIISRRVKPEMVKEFESLTSEMTERASRFPGYLGFCAHPLEIGIRMMTAK